ncbi:UNVERIFIED_CONTAM: hypothetical protein K2H54_029892 [Gekko kuhli]
MDGKYDKDLECVWTIVAPVNRLVNLTFNTFELEAASSFQNCRFDYVKLYDGSNANATVAGTFCGSSIPAPFLSADNFLTIKFVTDRSIERAGFTATYTLVERLCGGTYNATSTPQTVTSPYFPYAYPPFTVCRWVIDAPPEQQVRLVVQEFHLHPSQDCSRNYLEFQDSPLSNQEHANRVHRFCGAENFTIPEFYSYRRTAIAIFRSEAYMPNNGLSFSYKASGCGGTLYGEAGSLTSPEYPASYPNQTDCEWIIKAPRGRIVTINFVFINIEDPGDCTRNYLILYNGPDSSHPQIGPYCGTPGEQPGEQPGEHGQPNAPSFWEALSQPFPSPSGSSLQFAPPAYPLVAKDFFQLPIIPVYLLPQQPPAPGELGSLEQKPFPSPPPSLTPLSTIKLQHRAYIPN